MANPTKTAQVSLVTEGGQDFLQMAPNNGGRAVSWIDSTGAPQGALAAGMGGTPGGTNTAIQFNASGSFGGDAANLSWDNSTGSLTATQIPNTGALTSIIGGPTGSAAFQIDDTANPTDLTFSNAETNGTMAIASDGMLGLNSFSASVQIQDNPGNPMVEVGGTAQLGFYGATIIAKPTVTGAKAGNAALTSLIAKLVALGLIADGTT